VRILHVASGREWRGGQRQTWLLARGLAACGVTQAIVTRRGSELAARARETSIAVVPARWSAGLDPRALMTLVRAARNADILHAHDSHAVTLTAAAARFTARPFVATRRMTRLLRVAGPWRRAARVIAISTAVRRALVESGIAEAAIPLISPGIDVAETRKAQAVSWGEVSAIPQGVFVVLAVSALTPEKGLDVLVDAMAHPDLEACAVQCVIIGGGREAPALAARARAGPAAGRVHFLGPVADPLPFIAAAGGLVVPSREEAFGSIILDALALGIPVLGADVGGIGEALRHGGGVTFRAGDSRALAAEIRRLALDPDQRDRLGEAGRAAASHFDLRGMVDRTLAVYRSVMEDVERQ